MTKRYRFSALCYQLFVVVSIFLISACGQQQYGAVKFTSKPPGAEVINLKDDTVLGITPVRVLWKGKAGTSEKVVVQFNKPGYYEKIFSIWVNKRHDDESSAVLGATEIHAEFVKD